MQEARIPEGDTCLAGDTDLVFALEHFDPPRQGDVGITRVFIGDLGREAIDHDHGQAPVGDHRRPLQRARRREGRQHHDQGTGRKSGRQPPVVELGIGRFDTGHHLQQASQVAESGSGWHPLGTSRPDHRQGDPVTDPREVLRMTGSSDPVGPRNQEIIERAVSDSGLIICAWGAHGAHIGQDETVLGWLEDAVTYALGFSKDKQPRHPLYLKSDAPLLPMDGGHGR